MPLSTRDLTLMDIAFQSNDFMSSLSVCARSFPHMDHHFLGDARVNDLWTDFIAHPQVAEVFGDCERCGRHHYLDRGREVHVRNTSDPQRWCLNCYVNYAVAWADGTYRNYNPPRLEDYGVRGYHHGHREEAFGHVDYSNRGILGIEIETSMVDFDAITKVLNVGKVVAERDGSLDPTSGVEYIFAPCTLDQIVPGEYVHKIATILHESKTKAWSDDRCGMHISMNSSRMTHLHAGKVCKFINSHPSLFNLVSGRKDNSHAVFSSQTLCWESRNPHQDKYRAASRRGTERLEVRIFRSSVNFKRIRQNCELVDSVREFTRMASVRELTQFNYFDFLNEVGNRSKYRTIRQFLGLLPKKKSTYQSGLIEDEFLVDEVVDNRILVAS